MRPTCWATLGARYTLRMANHSSRRVEAVVSVDGRDAINGRPGDFRTNRGYLIPAWGSVDIDGWRISQSEAAAFRFSSVPHSYAAQTGSAREVGVIGVAMFPERYVPPVYVPRPLPYAAPHALARARRLRLSGAAARRRRAGGPVPPPRPHRRRRRRRGGTRACGRRRGQPVVAQVAPRPWHRVRRGGQLPHHGGGVRARQCGPSVGLLGVRYNDHDGLLAMGIQVDGDTCASDADLRLSAEPFPAADRRYAPPPAGWRRACGWR